MEQELILGLGNLGISALALILSVILKRKGYKTKTPEQIAEEANIKAQKYIAKQCKKYKINTDTKSDYNQNNTTNSIQNLENN